MSGPGNGNGNSVGSITDDLIERAKAIANRSDELLHLLEDARQKLLDSGREPEEKQTRQEQRRSRPPEQRGRPQGQRGRPEQRRSKPEAQRRFRPKPVPAHPAQKTGNDGEIPEGLRLLTTQMSVEGSSRDEIAARLKNDFDVTDPEQVLKSMGL
jgi:hypothetical protein